MSKLSDEYDGRLAVGRIDVRNNKIKVKQYKVRVTPTSIYFNGRAEVKRFEGYVKYDVLKADTEEVLKDSSGTTD